MIENFRNFEVGPDAFGATWTVEFRWQQNGISIRHSDTVDVKFFLASGGKTVEKVVALPHPALVALAEKKGRPLTDAWCLRLAALRIVNMIETGEDLEKTLVTMTPAEMDEATAQLEAAAA